MFCFDVRVIHSPLEPNDPQPTQIKKLEPELQIYRAQDQQILDLIVHTAEEEQQKKQADATEDSNVDLVEVISTSIAPKTVYIQIHCSKTPPNGLYPHPFIRLLGPIVHLPKFTQAARVFFLSRRPDPLSNK